MIKRDIVKKLSRKQIFLLCLFLLIELPLIVWIIGLLAPEALPALFGIL